MVVWLAARLQACVPYFETLEKWIYKGLIVDPYSEFLVEENEVIGKEKLQEDYNDSYPCLARPGVYRVTRSLQGLIPQDSVG